MAKPATKIKDLRVRKDAAVKGGSTLSTTIKNVGDALTTVARKG
jgi:hypothetical protein